MSKKYIVTIEEMVSEDFEVEANSMEEALEIAKRKYNSCEFVINPGWVTYKQMMVLNEKGDCSEWYEF